MFAYQVSCSSWESGVSCEFCHEKEFSREAFIEEVAKAMEDTVVPLVEEKFSKVMQEEYFFLNMEMIVDSDAFKIAMGKRGFLPMEYSASASFQGWSHIMGNFGKKDDWSIRGEQEKIHKRIRKAFEKSKKTKGGKK